MKRRKFLKNLGMASAAPVIVNGLPIQAIASSDILKLAKQNMVGDKVLVLIQLHGGNDGLNTLIPLDQYSDYYNLRPNIAIPESGNRQAIALDNTLGDAQQLGLHPDMLGMKALYDQGKVNIVQNVSYENTNRSHFRSRDIWHMGGGYNDFYDSGWVGRLLNEEFPGFPDAFPSSEMLDPPGLEIGNNLSLAFHRGNGIPIGLAIQNPNQFFNLISSVGIDPPTSLEDTFYGEELRYIAGIEEASNTYAERLKNVYDAGRNSANVLYPTTYPFRAPTNSLPNRLSPQLQTIARLLSGGVQTRVFLAKIGGFDTHASQVEADDPTMGSHAAQLYHLSEGIKAFQDDLRGLGLEDRVLTVTFTEFGRRAESNGSYGTDHGTAAPMFVIGSGVRPGITGNNPDLSDLDRGDLKYEIDYRSVFHSILGDFMGTDQAALEATSFNDFTKLNIIGSVLANDKLFNPVSGSELKSCFPNPVKDLVQFSFELSVPAEVNFSLYDTRGRKVMELARGLKKAGVHSFSKDFSRLQSGMYHYQLHVGAKHQSKKLIKL